MRQKNQAAVALGRLGGKARAKRPKALLSAIGKKGGAREVASQEGPGGVNVYDDCNIVQPDPDAIRRLHCGMVMTIGLLRRKPEPCVCGQHGPDGSPLTYSRRDVNEMSALGIQWP